MSVSLLESQEQLFVSDANRVLRVVFLVPSYRFEITLAFSTGLDLLRHVLELEPVIAELVGG